jgi:hypothetical protein
VTITLLVERTVAVDAVDEGFAEGRNAKPSLVFAKGLVPAIMLGESDDAVM